MLPLTMQKGTMWVWHVTVYLCYRVADVGVDMPHTAVFWPRQIVAVLAVLPTELLEIHGPTVIATVNRERL